MDRYALLAYLQRFNALALAAGLTTTDDSATGYGPAIDDALRFLGVAEADLPTAVLDQTQVSDGLALAKYTTLALLLVALAAQMDQRLGAMSMEAKRSQMFTMAQALYKEALTDISQRGYGPQDFNYGKIQLDIFEPITATGGAWGAPLGWY